MKFLCVACDEAMKLDHALPPEEGALTVVFRCPSCGAKTALMTNAMETQMVQSLGVKIGRPAPARAPMDWVIGSLENPVPTAGDPDPLVPEGGSPSPGPGEGTGSRCPFTGVVAEALAGEAAGPAWTAGAEERLARVPPAVQSMARKGIEFHARQRGYSEITEAVIDEVKARFGL